MRLASFLIQDRPTYGIVTDRGVIDLGARLGVGRPDLRSLLEADALGEVARFADDAPDGPLDGLRYLPVIPNPDKILCVGLNYEEHRVESQRERTEQPAIFIRLASSQVGHGEPILVPRESTRFDYEGELAIVIGRGGRRIAPEAAWNHIAGYACYNDGSVRDWQRHTTQWTPGKNFVATGGFGPWMVTADEIEPWTVLTLTTRLNGEVLQHASTDMLIHTIPKIVAYVSTFCPLVAGDVIATGTPGGVGARREPPVWMKPGDVCEVEIERVGLLRNPIAAD
jgi:2-keto-4-pentenoate hydratase/2-oxohepta-3-ene-1,7-dioic acid hydratase in catechol pathway